MAEFALEVWRSRAAERLRRASRAHRAEARRRYKRDLKFSSGIGVIIEWAKKQGYSVKFKSVDGGGEVDDENKVIWVCHSFTPEHQFYVLAHECGHILIGERERGARFSMTSTPTSVTEKKTLHYRIEVIDEELEAWERGRKLAGRLGIRIDKKKFHKFRVKYLQSYLKWALKIEGYEDDAA